MMTKNLTILGSTGSIGRQTLEVVEQLPVRIAALTAGQNVERMAEQCRRFRPQLAVMGTEEAAQRLREALAGEKIEIRSGMDGLIAAAEHPLSLGRLGGAPGGAPCFAVASAGGDGYAASWLPDGALGSAAVESGPCPTPSEALARLAERLVDQGMPAAGGEDDDLARYERLYAGDMETYKSTNLDELIRACRASARYGAAEKGGGGR